MKSVPCMHNYLYNLPFRVPDPLGNNNEKFCFYLTQPFVSARVPFIRTETEQTDTNNNRAADFCVDSNELNS